MSYWIHAKIDDSAVSAIVETAKDALAKLAELAGTENTVVTARDLLGHIIDPTVLHAGAGQAEQQTGSV